MNLYFVKWLGSTHELYSVVDELVDSGAASDKDVLLALHFDSYIIFYREGLESKKASFRFWPEIDIFLKNVLYTLTANKLTLIDNKNIVDAVNSKIPKDVIDDSYEIKITSYNEEAREIIQQRVNNMLKELEALDNQAREKFTVNIRNNKVFLFTPEKGCFRSHDVSGHVCKKSGWINTWLLSGFFKDSIDIDMCVRHIICQLEYKLSPGSVSGPVNFSIMHTAIQNKKMTLIKSFNEYFKQSRIQKSGDNLSMLCDVYLDLLNAGGTIPDIVDENLLICSQVTEKLRSNIRLRAGLRM